MTADRLDLDALAELEAAATAGPWETNQSADEESTTWIEHALGDVLNHDERGHGHMRENFAWMRRADAALIVALRNSAPALIAAARNCDAWHEAAFAGQVNEAHLTAERDAAQAALARVEALHVPTGHGFPRCERDDEVWPCATIRAVASEGQEAGGK